MDDRLIAFASTRIRLMGRVPDELCGRAQPGRDLSPHFGKRGEF